MEQLENWSVHGITIIVQSFCGLTEITVTVIKLQQKRQPCVKSIFQ